MHHEKWERRHRPTCIRTKCGNCDTTHNVMLFDCQRLQFLYSIASVCKTLQAIVGEEKVHYISLLSTLCLILYVCIMIQLGKDSSDEGGCLTCRLFLYVLC